MNLQFLSAPVPHLLNTIGDAPLAHRIGTTTYFWIFITTKLLNTAYIFYTCFPFPSVAITNFAFLTY